MSQSKKTVITGLALSLLLNISSQAFALDFFKKYKKTVAITVGAVVTIGSLYKLYQWYSDNKPSKPEETQAVNASEIKSENESEIKFERENIIGMEGYWASDPDITKDTYKGEHPWPKAHEKAWRGKEAFLKKLKQIESLAGEEFDSNSSIQITRYRGCALHRLRKGWCGNSEYKDTVNNVGWTDSFGSDYVNEFNVIPSKQFYMYVMNYSLPNSQR